MSNKRNRRGPKGPFPIKKVTSEQADAWIKRVKDAPILEIPPGRSVTKYVARIGILNPPNPIHLFSGEGLFPWIQLTDDTVYRLPDEYGNWAFDTVSVILAAGGNDAIKMFPVHIQFSESGPEII